MDSQVKERIVGAIVLVALGVWLIPWVLDGPDPAPGETAEPAGIRLPPGEEATAPIRTETVELAPGRSVGEPESGAVARAGSEPAVPGRELSEPAPSQAQPAAALPESAPPPAVAVAANAAAEPAGWAVQLGAFGQRENAEQVMRRVEGLGFEAFVSEFQSGSGTLYRVRVGGFATEAQAEAAADSLASHDFRVRVIRPE